MKNIYVIGDQTGQRIYSSQYGWCSPDNNHRLMTSLIYCRDQAESMARMLQDLPCGSTKDVVIYPVSITLGRPIALEEKQNACLQVPA